tara:strand:+ start:6155 stop:7333 length:1179 start_codon:yes stop_codon:yes gene_type:complete
MRLDLLMERELFDDVFIVTLSKYLKAHYRWNGTIKWNKFNLFHSTKHTFLVNDKLNVIYHYNLQRDKLSELTAEFSYNSNFFRNILQNIYIQFATNKIFEKVLSKYTVNLTDYTDEFSKWVFIPGNHSIRIIDLRKNRCIVILKDGFNEKFLKNEINIRKEYPYLPIPKLVNYNINNLYYEEERIVGLPYNRIANEEIRNKSLKKILKPLFKLYRETHMVIQKNSYVNMLKKDFDVAIDNLPPIYKSEDKQKFIMLFDEISMSIAMNEINLVITHGDFQPANIIIDSIQNNRAYLIDWEYSKKRSFLYDFLVFEVQARKTIGLAERLKLLKMEKFKWIYQSLSIPYIDLKNAMIKVFLLEDFCLRIEELKIPTLKHKSLNLENFIKEVSYIL